MVEVQWCGQITLDTKAIGNTIKRVVRASFYILMETFTMATGSIIKQMAVASIRILKELGMKVIGRMINKTEKVLKLGLKGLNTKESTFRA